MPTFEKGSKKKYWNYMIIEDSKTKEGGLIDDLRTNIQRTPMVVSVLLES